MARFLSGSLVTPSVTITSDQPDSCSTVRDLVSRMVRTDTDRGGLRTTQASATDYPRLTQFRTSSVEIRIADVAAAKGRYSVVDDSLHDLPVMLHNFHCTNQVVKLILGKAVRLLF